MIDPKHRYVVTFYDPKTRQTRRSRTIANPSGIYGSKAKAEALRRKLVAKNVSNPKIVELAHPERVTRWAKWTPQRSAQRIWLRAKGFVQTSGDRNYNSLTPPNVSDHYEERLDSWADDWWHADYSKMVDVGGKLQRGVRGIGQLKQVLVHDAGTGEHLHVAGYTRR